MHQNILSLFWVTAAKPGARPAASGEPCIPGFNAIPGSQIIDTMLFHSFAFFPTVLHILFTITRICLVRSIIKLGIPFVSPTS